LLRSSRGFGDLDQTLTLLYTEEILQLTEGITSVSRKMQLIAVKEEFTHFYIFTVIDKQHQQIR